VARGSYAAVLDPTLISITKILVQIQAPASAVLELERAWVTKAFGSAGDPQIDQMERIAIVRQDVAGTGTSITPAPLDPDAPASGVTAKGDIGLDADISAYLFKGAADIAAGWLFVPQRGESLIVPPSGILGLFLGTFEGALRESPVFIVAGLIWRELG